MPKTKDSRVGFVTVNNGLEFWFGGAVYWGDDDVEGEDDEIILLGSPLDVVF